jgi:hypothetical protein
MRLATEPIKVRFPAKVELIATICQARPGSGKFAMNGFKIKTAGTLLSRFDRRAVAPDKASRLPEYGCSLDGIRAGKRSGMGGGRLGRLGMAA